MHYKKIIITIFLIFTALILGTFVAFKIRTSWPYNDKSWQTILEKSCIVFYDGCNTCWKQKDGIVECTSMACRSYKKPFCLDKTN